MDDIAVYIYNGHEYFNLLLGCGDEIEVLDNVLELNLPMMWGDGI